MIFFLSVLGLLHRNMHLWKDSLRLILLFIGIILVFSRIIGKEIIQFVPDSRILRGAHINTLQTLTLSIRRLVLVPKHVWILVLLCRLGTIMTSCALFCEHQPDIFLRSRICAPNISLSSSWIIHNLVSYACYLLRPFALHLLIYCHF